MLFIWTKVYPQWWALQTMNTIKESFTFSVAILHCVKFSEAKKKEEKYILFIGIFY